MQPLTSHHSQAGCSSTSTDSRSDFFITNVSLFDHHPLSRVQELTDFILSPAVQVDIQRIIFEHPLNSFDSGSSGQFSEQRIVLTTDPVKLFSLIGIFNFHLGYLESLPQLVQMIYFVSQVLQTEML